MFSKYKQYWGGLVFGLKLDVMFAGCLKKHNTCCSVLLHLSSGFIIFVDQKDTKPR